MPRRRGEFLRLSVTVPKWILQAMQKIAELRQEPLSRVVASVLEQYIRQHYPQLLPKPKE